MRKISTSQNRHSTLPKLTKCRRLALNCQAANDTILQRNFARFGMSELGQIPDEIRHYRKFRTYSEPVVNGGLADAVLRTG